MTDLEPLHLPMLYGRVAIASRRLDPCPLRDLYRRFVNDRRGH